MDDSKIVDLYLSRDEAAIRETAASYGSRLRNLSLGIVRDRETSLECENDTYLKAWNSIPPNEPRTYLYAYLARIIRTVSINVCRDRNRLKRRAYICELSAEMEECIPYPEDSACGIGDRELAGQLNGFLESLGGEKRGIFLRRYWYMQSVREIAVYYSVSEGNIKTTLFRLRKQLREQLEKEGYFL